MRKKTNDLSEEAMDKIRKEMTTVFELQRAMALLENLTKYMEKKL